MIVRSTVNVSIDFRWREAICARQPVTEVHARRCNASTSRICRRASMMEGKRATSNLPGIVSFTGWGRNRYRRKADNSSEAVNPFEADILLRAKKRYIYLFVYFNFNFILNFIYLNFSHYSIKIRSWIKIKIFYIFKNLFLSYIALSLYRLFLFFKIFRKINRND